MARVVGRRPRGPPRRRSLDGDVVDYDSLVVATGAVSHDFGIPGVAEHTLPLKHLEDALALRVHVLTRFEEAAADPSIATDGGLDVVVCGGGPTGVEMAGGLRELYTKVLAKDFPAAARRRGADHARRDGRPAADAVHRAVVGRARRTLTRRGVDVRLGTGVRSRRQGARAPDRRHDDRRRHDRVGDRRARPRGWPRRSARRRRAAGASWSRPTFRSPVIPRCSRSATSPRPPARRRAAAAGRPAGDPGRQARRPPDRRAGCTGGRRSRSATTTRGRWRRSAVTTPSPSWPTGGASAARSGWLAWLGLHLVYLMGFRNRVPCSSTGRGTTSRSTAAAASCARPSGGTSRRNACDRRRRDWSISEHCGDRADSFTRSDSRRPSRTPGAVLCLLHPPSVPATSPSPAGPCRPRRGRPRRLGRPAHRRRRPQRRRQVDAAAGARRAGPPGARPRRAHPADGDRRLPAPGAVAQRGDRAGVPRPPHRR